MKYFFISFFSVILILLPFESYAEDQNFAFPSHSQAKSACLAKLANYPSWSNYRTGNCDTSTVINGVRYRYLRIGVKSRLDENSSWSYFIYKYDGVCLDPNLEPNSSGECTGPKVCSSTENSPDCLCSDGLPRNSGQWTICDRPPLKFCESLGRAIPETEFCSLVPDENNCPTDTDFIDGQCVNKCGINSTYNGFTNKCEDNKGNEEKGETCPANYHKNIDGVCVPNSCPSTHKLENGVCVLDTDPKTETDTTTVTNNDNSTTTTIVTTTTINNPDGTTTTTTNTTITQRDSDGNVTSVDSSTEERTDKPSEDDSSVSGGSCESPPACSGDAIQCAILNQQWKTACTESDDEVSDISDCSGGFICKGSIFECANLRQKNKQYCAQTESAVIDFTQTAKFKAEFDASNDLDSDGVLTSLKPNEVDLFAGTGVSESINGLLNITGKAGSCPEDRVITFGNKTMTFPYEPICNVARLSSPFFIFFVFVRRARALLKVITDK